MTSREYADMPERFHQAFRCVVGRDGADGDAIAEAERALGLTLPPVLSDLLSSSNGGDYEGDSGFMRLYGVRLASACIDIVKWNAPETWRDCYESSVEGLVFFACNAVGGQFALDLSEPKGSDYMTVYFDGENRTAYGLAETSREFIDSTLFDEELAPLLLYRDLYREAIAKFGRLPEDHIFGFAQPLSLGGSDTVNNVDVVLPNVHLSFLGQVTSGLSQDPEGDPGSSHDYS
jgi:hypothetical protein